MINFDKEIKLGENEKYIFWDKGMTGKIDDDFRIVMAESKKNGFKEYLLLEKNKPIYNNTNIESVWYRYEIIKLSKGKNN